MPSPGPAGVGGPDPAGLNSRLLPGKSQPSTPSELLCSILCPLPVSVGGVRVAPAPAPGGHTVYFVQEREKVSLRVAPSNGLPPAQGDDFHLVGREEAPPCGMSQTLGTEGRWGPPEPGGDHGEPPSRSPPTPALFQRLASPCQTREGRGVGQWGTHGIFHT